MANNSSSNLNQQFSLTSLYVGDLNPDVNEANLFEIFSSFGQVASIRVCRDSITRRSLGYAYVNFFTQADAERAQEQLNNTSIKGRPCRIMISQRDPSIRKSGKGNIFIKNLAKEIDTKALYDTFNRFGAILSCKIELDEHNQSKGYGYIQFQDNEAAESAIENVNGMMLYDKKVYVGPFIPRKERTISNSDKFTNIFIKNLPETVDDEKLKEMFSVFGPIKSVSIMKEEDGTKSKGFGFVDFENPEDAAKAVEEYNNKEIDGKELYVGRAQKKSERESELRHKFEQLKLEQSNKYQGVNLYVKNLEDDVTDEKLLNLFKEFGNITSAKIMTDAKGNSRGFGFVCFSTPEEATKAVSEMNGKMVGTKPLYVGLAQKKENRKAQLEAQFAQRGKIMIPPIRGGMPPMFPNAPPFIYQPPGPGFVYPPQMGIPPPRGGRFPPSAYSGPVMPGNFMAMVPPVARGQMKNPRSGGPVANKRGGMKMNGPAMQYQPPTMNPEEYQKQQIGEQLYVMTEKQHPELAGKLTGMILDGFDLNELSQFLEDPELLNEKIDEALKILNESKSQE